MAELAAETDEFTESAALAALTRACQSVGLDADGASLIRLGSNAVFRLDSEVVARVAPSERLLSNAVKQISVARWLEHVGYPATRAIDVPQPRIADRRVVTFWLSISKETVYAPLRAVGELIRGLHDLPAPSGLELPRLMPFGSPADELPAFPGLPDADADYLRSRIEWARAEFPTLPFALTPGVIHGDANVGNVLCDDDGTAVLIDLDSFSFGPREWDLIQTALFYDRLGWHSADEYAAFVEAYGYDIMQWDGYQTLADMREIAMTSWLSLKASGSERAAEEAQRRISDIRSGSERRNWGAH